jgi:pSer/pThr/pTyr-binding forkhead associated (FHA) protein
MIKCPHCGRENDDSFKFCLDCGNPLAGGPPEAAAGAAPATDPEAGKATDPGQPAAPEPPPPAPEPPPASPAAAPAAPESPPAAPAAAPAAPEPPPAAPAAAPAEAACPKCGTAVGADDAFCASCGQNLKQVAGGSTMFMHTAAPDAEAKPRIRLVLIKPDGSEGTVFSLAEQTFIGRTQGMIMFPKDPYISPKHAELRIEQGKPIIRDLNSLNGVYRKMTAEERIVPGTYFRIGRQLLRLEVPGEFQQLDIQPAEQDDSQYWGSPAPQVWARLVQVLEGGKIGEIHLLTQAQVVIGREQGEVRFPEDSFISGSHCQLTNKDGDCFLSDLGSSNGTYLRIQDEHALDHGDRIQIGNQVLRVDIG